MHPGVDAPAPPFPRPVGAPPPVAPAARLLHSGQAALGPNGSVLVARQRFTANPALRLGQLALLGQGGLAIYTGINLVRGMTNLANLGAGVNLSAEPSLASNYGVGIVVIGGVLVIGALTVSIPSKIVRTLLSLLEVIALGVTLAVHFGGGSVLGFVSVLALGASGSSIIPFAGVVAIQSAIIYLLAIHPATYRAFGVKATWASHASY